MPKRQEEEAQIRAPSSEDRSRRSVATVQVDLIGPYTIKGRNRAVLDFMCMTMIDPATGWFEVVELPTTKVFRNSKKKDEDGNYVNVEIPDEIFDKTSASISRLFNRAWLSRYPRPKEVVCDNGSEFKLHFIDLLRSYSITRKPTTSKNPQANAICERVHGVLGDMMHTSGINNVETTLKI